MKAYPSSKPAIQAGIKPGKRGPALSQDSSQLKFCESVNCMQGGGCVPGGQARNAGR